MQKTTEETVTNEGPLALRWHRLQAAYRFCNLATHHVLGFTVKLVLLLYFGFAVLFLTLRYAILPNIDHYKGDIERMASHAVGNPVTIARIYASWNGLRPHLFLGDVVLRDRQGAQVLALPSVQATLSWWSVLGTGVRFESLELIRPDLAVRRDPDGKLYAAGVYFDPAKPGDGKGADWLLSQREIVIREGRLAWADGLRGTPTLVLDNVNLLLRNQWRRHQFAIQATPPAALSAPLDVRADFVHPAFSQRISDLSLWKGEIYADLRRADLAAWKTYLDYPLALSSGSGSLRAWVSLDQAKLAGFTADVGLTDLAAVLGPDLPALDLVQVRPRPGGGRLGAPRRGRPPYRAGRFLADHARRPDAGADLAVRALRGGRRQGARANRDPRPAARPANAGRRGRAPAAERQPAQAAGRFRPARPAGRLFRAVAGQLSGRAFLPRAGPAGRPRHAGPAAAPGRRPQR